VEAEGLSPRALVALARAGVGTAVLADDALGDGHEGRALFAATPLSSEVWLYAGRVRSPAVEAFVEEAKAAALSSSSASTPKA